MSRRNKPLTDFGIKVNMQLMKLNKSQTWLISEIKKKIPEKYVDSSLLCKIFIGDKNSPDIVNAINEILEL